MPKSVIISDRAFITILMETHLKITTETGGVFLGYRKDDTWYVIEAIDPGPNSIFTQNTFEYDRNYINHLINKVKSIYVEPLGLIGLWHRHPGSFDGFSQTDNKTNSEFAKQDPSGAISALVNIDPEFRLTMYSVTMPLNYGKIIDVRIGNRHIPKELIAYKSSGMMLGVINSESKQFFSEKKESFWQRPFWGSKTQYSLDTAKKFSFSNKLHEVLEKEKNLGVARRFESYFTISDVDLEWVLETMQSDFDYFETQGIAYELEKSPTGTLLFKEINPNLTSPAVLSFFVCRKDICFAYNEKAYGYQEGLFEKIHTS